MSKSVDLCERIGRKSGFPAGSSWIMLLLVLALLLRPAEAWAFHEGGVARCAGCHIMHGEIEGQIVMVGNAPLLTAASPTDLCLTCHSGNNGVFGFTPLSPPIERGAGNFVFLLEDNLNDGASGQTNPISGEAAGHSIISLTHGLMPDSRWTFSPGGNFPSNELSCISCHDPHGNGNFRLLHGDGPVQGGLFTFIYPAPDAEGIDATSMDSFEFEDHHNAYRAGMDLWCANCHGEYHDEDGSSAFEHPFNESLSSGQAQCYNRYDGDANSLGGDSQNSYLTAVPFENPGMTIENREGPGVGSRVMCLTCHRAHASSSPEATRWDVNVEALGQDGVISGSYPIPSPYPDPNQGTLCSKCHRGAGWLEGYLPSTTP